jgi:superfamily I DNA and/or RNA helicase
MNNTERHLHYFRKVVQLASFPKINDLTPIGRMDASFSGGINSLYLTETSAGWSSTSSALLMQFELVMHSYFKNDTISKKLSKLGLKNKTLTELIQIRNQFFKDTTKTNEYAILDNIINPKLMMVPFYYQNINDPKEVVKPIAFLVKVYFEDYKNKVRFTPVGIPSFSIDNIIVSEKIAKNEYVFTNIDDYNKILDSNFFDSEIKTLEDMNKWNTWLDFILKSIKGIDDNKDYRKVDQTLFLDIPEKMDIQERTYDNLIKIIKADSVKLPLFEKYIKETELETPNKDISVLMRSMMTEKMNSFNGQLKVNKSPAGYFGLNNNQRLFVKTLNDGKSDILALNGPPGTGKTTVLQSAISTLIVNSIVNGDCKMPIMFGLAATNQAKNNIIDGFKIKNILDSNNNGLLSNRWIILDGISEIDYGIQLNPKEKGEFGLDKYAHSLEKTLFNDNEKYFIEQYNKLTTADLIIFNKVAYESLVGKKLNISISKSNNISDIQKNLKSLIVIFNEFLNDIEYNKNNILNNFSMITELEDLINEYLEEIKNNSVKIDKENESIVNNASLLNELTSVVSHLNEKLTIFTIDEQSFKDAINDVHSLWHSYLKELGFFDKIFMKLNTKKHVLAFYSFVSSKLNNKYKINTSIDSLDLINDFFLENYKHDITDNKYLTTSYFTEKNEIIKEILDKNKELEPLILKKDTFLKNISAIEAENNSIIVKIDNIKKDILSYRSGISCLLSVITEQANVLKINELVNSNSLEHTKIFTEVSAVIDNMFKPLLFNLSMKYYEAQFIIDGKDLYDKKENYLKNGSFKANRTKDKFELFSNVFPVFVSTMHSLAKNMGYYDVKTKTQKYMFNFIDYAVVDESGQCSPEIGAISFLFSKKAIVVGDTDQIAPIYTISNDVDHIYYSKIVGKTIDYDEFDNLPFNCSSGSVMKIAQNNSLYNPYTEYLSRGLYLLEHRRCPKEIIEYCNELVYSNKLEYTIGSDFETFTRNKLHLDNQKPWNFIQVDGNYKNPKGDIHNSEEAHVIAKWIENHYVELTRKNTIDKILAVLTPYTGQERAIRSALSKINNENIPRDAFKDLVIGTAHKLQGAERDIILYSSTWRIGETTASFIDSSKSVINVAISRAKQSIYVFGDQQSFENSTGKSTRIMWKYLKKHL